MPEILTVGHFGRQPMAGQHSIERLYEDVRSSISSEIRVDVFNNKNISKGVMKRVSDIWRASRKSVDVYHVLGDVHYITYLMPKSRTILTIHDLGTINSGFSIKKLFIYVFWFLIPSLRCNKIVTISEETRRQLIKYKISSDKIVVIPNCVSEEFTYHPKYFNKIKPRILQIGSTENKNVARLIHAISSISCELVLVGTPSQSILDLLSQHNIVFEAFANLSRDDLLDQYVKCDLVAFVSTYEGFGLPIVEANAVGRPVLTSAIPPMSEIAGGACVLVNPYSVSDIRDGIESIIHDEKLRKSLVLRGLKNAERFDRSNVAAQYAKLYTALASRRKGDS